MLVSWGEFFRLLNFKTRSESVLKNRDELQSLTEAAESDRYLSNLHGHVDVPAGILAGMHDHYILWQHGWTEDVDFGGQLRGDDRDHHKCVVVLLRTTE